MNNKAAKSSSLRKFLQKPGEEDATTVHPSIQAEVKLAMMIVHHNTFFNLSDHLTRLVNSEFQGSAAAENLLVDVLRLLPSLTALEMNLRRNW